MTSGDTGGSGGVDTAGAAGSGGDSAGNGGRPVDSGTSDGGSRPPFDSGAPLMTEAGTAEMVGSCTGTAKSAPHQCAEYWWVPGGSYPKQVSHDGAKANCEGNMASWSDDACPTADLIGVCDLVRYAGFKQCHYSEEAAGAAGLKAACMVMTGTWYAP